MLGKGDIKIYLCDVCLHVGVCQVCVHMYIPMSTPMCACLCPSACAPPCAHVRVDLYMDAPAWGTMARTCMCTLVCAFSCPCLMQINVTNSSSSSWAHLGSPTILAVLASLPVLILAANLVLFYYFFFLLSTLPRWPALTQFRGMDIPLCYGLSIFRPQGGFRAMGNCQVGRWW